MWIFLLCSVCCDHYYILVAGKIFWSTLIYVFYLEFDCVECGNIVVKIFKTGAQQGPLVRPQGWKD